MPTIHVDLFSSFDELYNYWKKVDEVKTPLTAIILSTEIAGLDKKITHFVIDNRNELTDMSGETCAVFMATPRKNAQETLLSDDLVNGYREISYSIARLFGITPDQFPSIVFFDNLIRPKQMVVISLNPILGLKPTNAEITIFFRSLFSITQKITDLHNEETLQKLQEAILKKWQDEKKTSTDFTKIITTATSLTEISKNIIEIIKGISGPLTAIRDKLL